MVNDVRLYCLLCHWTPYPCNEQTFAAKIYFLFLSHTSVFYKTTKIEGNELYLIVIFFGCDLLIDVENKFFSAYLLLKLCVSWVVSDSLCTFFRDPKYLTFAAV